MLIPTSKMNTLSGSRSNSVRKSLLSFIPILLLININTVSSQSPVFLVHPVSTAAIEGTTVEFTCTAENATLSLTYAVNNTAAAEQVIINRGFTQSLNIETLGGNRFRRNLTVTVSAALNNNSEIACLAVGLGASAAESNTATLTVQGPLSSVNDLSYTYIDSSTVNISWSPPFTLLGTYITGYNISVTSNGTITNYFTSNTNYELLLTDITNSSCNEINITVSGYNGLNGESNTVSALSFQIITLISVVITDSLRLDLELNFSQCDEYIPTSVTIDLLINSTVVDSTNVNLVTDSNNILNVTDVFMLNESQYYTISVSYSILDGDYIVMSNAIFDTFGRVCLKCISSTITMSTTTSSDIFSPSPSMSNVTEISPINAGVIIVTSVSGTFTVVTMVIVIVFLMYFIVLHLDIKHKRATLNGSDQYAQDKRSSASQHSMEGKSDTFLC